MTKFNKISSLISSLDSLIKNIEAEEDKKKNLSKSHLGQYNKFFSLDDKKKTKVKYKVTYKNALEKLQEVEKNIEEMDKKLKALWDPSTTENNQKKLEQLEEIISNQYSQLVKETLYNAHSLMARILFDISYEKKDFSNYDKIIHHCDQSDSIAGAYGSIKVMNDFTRINARYLRLSEENEKELNKLKKQIEEFLLRVEREKSKLGYSDISKELGYIGEINKNQLTAKTFLPSILIKLEKYQDSIKVCEELEQRKEEMSRILKENDIATFYSDYVKSYIMLGQYENAFPLFQTLFLKHFNELVKEGLVDFYIGDLFCRANDNYNENVSRKAIILGSILLREIYSKHYSKDTKSELLFYIGRLKCDLGKLDEALKDFQEAAKLGLTKAYVSVGLVYYILKNYREAIDACDQVISSNDQNLPYENKLRAKINKSNVLVKLGKYDEAIKYCDEVYQDENSTENLKKISNISKAISKLQQGKIEDVIALYDGINIQEFSSYLAVEDFLQVITILSKQQKYDEALHCFSKYGLKENPQIQLKKASILIKKREISQARVILKQLIEKGNISDELKEKAILELEMSRGAITETEIRGEEKISYSSLVPQFKKEKIKTHADNLSDAEAITTDPILVKKLLRSITKPPQGKEQETQKWYFQNGKKIEAKNVIKVDRHSKYNLYASLTKNISDELDDHKKKQVINAIQKFARGDSTGIKFLTGGIVELKLLGSHGVGDLRLWSDHLVKNDKGKLLVIFNHNGDHGDVSRANEIKKTCSDSILTTLADDVCEFEQNLVGESEADDFS